MTLLEVCAAIIPADQAAMARAQEKWSRVGKPLGSLGLLEDMVVRMAGIFGTEDFSIAKKAVVPFCADNGRDSGFSKHLRWPVVRLWCKIIVACLPAAVLGFLLDDWLDAHLYNSVVVAIMLIVYGVAFILIERRPRVPSTTKLSRITYKQAVLVGAWQVLAMIPGTSRSGATIVGGLLCGMSRPCASQFTFFLAIPVMAGASGLKVVKYILGGSSFTMAEVLALVVGCVVAFLVSMAAIRFLMSYVKKHTFTAFGWYRIALGLVVLGIWIAQTFMVAA